MFRYNEIFHFPVWNLGIINMTTILTYKNCQIKSSNSNHGLFKLSNFTKKSLVIHMVGQTTLLSSSKHIGLADKSSVLMMLFCPDVSIWQTIIHRLSWDNIFRMTMGDSQARQGWSSWFWYLTKMSLTKRKTFHFSLLFFPSSAWPLTKLGWVSLSSDYPSQYHHLNNQSNLFYYICRCSPSNPIESFKSLKMRDDFIILNLCSA